MIIFFQKLKSLFLIILELLFNVQFPSSAVKVDSYFFIKLMKFGFCPLTLNFNSKAYLMLLQIFYLFWLYLSPSNLSSSILNDLKLLISPSSFKILWTLECDSYWNSLIRQSSYYLDSIDRLVPNVDWTLGSVT